MKIVNTLQHYVRFGYKTFVVNNFVLDDPSDFEEVLKDEYVYKNGKLFKALKIYCKIEFISNAFN